MMGSFKSFSVPFAAQCRRQQQQGLFIGLSALLLCSFIAQVSWAQPHPTAPEKPKAKPAIAKPVKSPAKPVFENIARLSHSKPNAAKATSAPPVLSKKAATTTLSKHPGIHPNTVEQASKDDPNILDLDTESASTSAVAPVQTTATVSPTTPSSPVVSEPSLIDDAPANTDNQPLLLDETQQPKASQTSTNMLIRMTLSLVAVLALMIGFLKWTLPALVERYPAFFNGLKQNQQSQGPTQNRLAKTNSKQKQYLEHLSDGNTRFNVISSTPLGKGRELHLVEIKGRQLVIATTPYTVTLVKDLTELEPTETPEPESRNSSIGGLRGWAPTSGSFSGPEPSYHQLKTETYPEIPTREKLKPKPFAEKLPLSNDAPAALRYTKPSAPTESTPPLHLKYLNAGPGLHSNLYETSQQLDPVPTEEDVMVLDDYEDFYSGSGNARTRPWE